MSSKRQSPYELLDEARKRVESASTAAFALRTALPYAVQTMDVGGVEWMQDQWAQLEARWARDAQRLRVEFDAAVRQAARVPALPLDCWQLIAELVLGRRPLWHWAPERVPGEAPGLVEPSSARVVARTDLQARHATKYLHKMRELNRQIRERVDLAVVRTIRLPPRENRTPKQYTARVLQLANQFGGARELVIMQEHIARGRLSKVIQTTVADVLVFWNAVPRDGPAPTVRSLLKPSREQKEIVVDGAYVIGQRLQPGRTPAGAPAHYAEQRLFADSIRCVGGQIHIVAHVCLSQLAHFTDYHLFDCEALWIDGDYRDTSVAWEATLHERPELTARLRRIYVNYALYHTNHYGREERAAFRVEPAFRTLRTICAHSPALQEVHVVAFKLPDYLASDFEQWHTEAAGRYKLMLHVSTYFAEDLHAADTFRDALARYSLQHLLRRDALALCETAKRSGIL